MDFMVTIPDNADPKTVDSLESSIEAAGGTWTPAPPGAEGGADQAAEGMAPPGQTPGGAMPGMDPMAALAAGPGAGMSPGAAMSGVGARALRPR
jgi:hypothetical protein